MKVGKLNRDELAKELFKIGSELENYNFDMFYDIQTIMNLNREKRGVTEEAQKDVMHLFIRKFGTHSLIESNEVNQSEELKAMKGQSEEHYKLVFCWNVDYLYSETFVVISKID